VHEKVGLLRSKFKTLPSWIDSAYDWHATVERYVKHAGDRSLVLTLIASRSRSASKLGGSSMHMEFVGGLVRVLGNEADSRR